MKRSKAAWPRSWVFMSSHWQQHSFTAVVTMLGTTFVASGSYIGAGKLQHIAKELQGGVKLCKMHGNKDNMLVAIACKSWLCHQHLWFLLFVFVSCIVPSIRCTFLSQKLAASLQNKKTPNNNLHSILQGGNQLPWVGVPSVGSRGGKGDCSHVK